MNLHLDQYFWRRDELERYKSRIQEASRQGYTATQISLRLEHMLGINKYAPVLPIVRSFINEMNPKPKSPWQTWTPEMQAKEIEDEYAQNAGWNPFE